MGHPTRARRGRPSAGSRSRSRPCRPGLPRGISMLVTLATITLTRIVSQLAHESAHASCAFLLGYRKITIAWSHTDVHDIDSAANHSQTVRHAGWVFSLALAVTITCCANWLPLLLGVWSTALDAMAVPLPAGDASATDAAADAVRVQTRECGCESAAREGSVSLGGLLMRDAM